MVNLKESQSKKKIIETQCYIIAWGDVSAPFYEELLYRYICSKLFNLVSACAKNKT